MTNQARSSTNMRGNEEVTMAHLVVIDMTTEDGAKNEGFAIGVKRQNNQQD